MNNKENEILTSEERKELNKKLKQAEDLTLPESLKEENIEKLLCDSDKIVPITEKNRKKSSRKKWGWVASVAAMLVVAFTSIALIQPWQKAPVVLENEGEAPKTYDYAEIEAMFSEYSEKYKSNEFRSEVNNLFSYSLKDGEVMMEDSADSMESVVAGTPSVNGSNYGKTNEQVYGVNEADIIKNDGKYIYIVNPDNAKWDEFYRGVEDNPQGEVPKLEYNCSVSIVKPSADGTMNVEAVINVVNDSEDVYYMTINEMYVSGNKLIALCECDTISDEQKKNGVSVYSRYNYEQKRSLAVCFDISDVNNPVEMWRVWQDGSYISSRLIGSQLVMLSQYRVDITAQEEEVIESCIPTYSYNGCDCARIAPQDIYIMEHINGSTYLVASTVDVTDSESFKMKAVLGAGENVYCNTESLYATSTSYSSRYSYEEVFGVTSQITEIYKFDIRNNNMEYVAKGSVEGRALNQFSMDEHNGYLRIATTTGDWGDGLTNQVYVLDGSLAEVGRIDGIAKGETIKSVRFTGDTGYVVTFEQTDPLFVIDLKNPQSPVIVGELKIPGFSTYLHPVGDGLVLGVGVDGDENGENGGMKASLFDVSDPVNPREVDKIVVSPPKGNFEWSYIYSEAYYSHKALCYDDDNKVMYIPYQLEVGFPYNSSDASDYRTKNYGCIQGVMVDAQNKKLVSVNECAVLFDNSENYPSGFGRVTYIDNVLFGYTRELNSIYSFDKVSGDALSSLNME